ncbi:hypothetical protein CYG49_03900, partial [Candidatus Saccharibacteria bacterium]
GDGDDNEGENPVVVPVFTATVECQVINGVNTGLVALVFDSTKLTNDLTGTARVTGPFMNEPVTVPVVIPAGVKLAASAAFTPYVPGVTLSLELALKGLPTVTKSLTLPACTTNPGDGDGDNGGEQPGDGDDNEGENPVVVPNPNDFPGHYATPDCEYATVFATGEYRGEGEVAIALQSLHHSDEGWRTEASVELSSGDEFVLEGESLKPGEKRAYRIIASFTDDQTGVTVLASFLAERPAVCDTPTDPGDGDEGDGGSGEQPGHGDDNRGNTPDDENVTSPGNGNGNDGRNHYRPIVPSNPLPQSVRHVVEPVFDVEGYNPPVSSYRPKPPAYYEPVYGDSLPYTGISGLGQLVAVGFGAVVLGGLVLLGLRRRNPPVQY